MRPALRSPLLAALAAGLLVSACRDTTAPPSSVGSLRLSTDSAVVHVDSALQLGAEVLDATGHPLTGRRVTWVVFDTTVARVDTEGLLQGLVVGGTTLVAASESALVQVPVAVVVRYQAVSAGESFGCGLEQDGTPYCWGWGLGRYVPTRVSGVPALQRLTLGSLHGCGLTATGEAYCWGKYTALGGGDSASTAWATARVAGEARFSQIAAGENYTCGLSLLGEALCWGGHWEGAMGHAGYLVTPSPAAPGLTFATLAGGAEHACGLTATGDAYCWGDNYYGQLGSSAASPSCLYGYCSPTPAKVDSAPPLVSIVAGGVHTCGLTAAGEAYCWGDNGAGELGDSVSGTCFAHQYYSFSLCSQVPVRVSGGLRFTALAVGDHWTCGLTATGEVFCWGYLDWGPVHTFISSPVPGAGTLRFRSLAAAPYSRSICGMGTDGIAYCWGDNLDGALGVAAYSGGSWPFPARVLFQR
jgi:alpha-tubulin suppressor-like RCC1 family protein